MRLLVFSIFDNVSEQSICVTMHHTIPEAQREFRRVCERPEVQPKAKDLTLVEICEFNTTNLDITPLEHITVGVGEEYVRSITISEPYPDDEEA